MSYSTTAPDVWDPDFESDLDSMRSYDQCVFKDQTLLNFGWLSTELAPYSEGTSNLKTNAHTRPVGKRPVIELEPTDHPSPSNSTP
ncbi:DUF2199 domain-containing protein [Streptomyces sp. NPDC060022]|uniref:DUF2199 domain-containing protein n=1 Tax=Streptomyces sp. NPDC060022 TaxID=3347039 RepID=UPI0036B7CBFC